MFLVSFPQNASATQTTGDDDEEVSFGEFGDDKEKAKNPFDDSIPF
jgi:hypothetical protein